MKNKKGFTIMEVLVVAGIFLAMVAILTPFVRMTKSRAANIKCANNLRHISLGLHAYAADNNEAFPADLGVLYPDHIKDEKAFDCPASKNLGTPDKPDYNYVSALTESSPQNEVIVYDLDGNHRGGGRNILRIDGSVDRVREGTLKPR